MKNIYLLAQVPQSFGIFNGIGGISNKNSPSDLAVTISATIGIFTVVAGLWFLFQLLIGGIKWVSAGGSKDTLSAAQKRITSALTGLLVVVLSYALVSLLSAALGLNFLNLSDLFIITLTP